MRRVSASTAVARRNRYGSALAFEVDPAIPLAAWDRDRHVRAPAGTGFFVRDNDVYAGRAQVQRTPDQRAAFVDYPADGGSGVAVLRADLGSFSDTASFALAATLDGVWRDGPAASLVSNGDVAMDDSSPKQQRFPELDDAGAHSLDVAVGVLFSPHGGATIVIQAASLDICC